MKKSTEASALLGLYIVLAVLTVALIAAIAVLVIHITGGDGTEVDIPDTTAESTDRAEETDPVSEKETEAPEPEYREIVMTFVGDCMLSSKYGAKGMWYFNDFAPTKDPEYFFKNVGKYFQNDDFTIANCENVFSSADLSPVAKNHSPAYWYKSDPKFANIFKVGSVEILSVSNNHVGDFGKQGEIDTKAALDAQGLIWGDASKPIILEKYGIKIAILMCNMYNESQAAPIIKWLEEVKEQSDFQIVYFHGGTERIYEPEVWKKRACRKLVDSGADLVIGSHPHVLQPYEEYNGAEIIYSMGNFLFGGAHQTDNRTIIFQKTLRVKDEKIILTDSKIVPCFEYINYDYIWQPTPMEEGSPEYEKIMSFMFGKSASPK